MMSEGAGTGVKDSSGYGNDGVISGATWTSPGHFPSTTSDWCLSFDGNNDYVTCADSASLDILDAITIELWLKYSVKPGSGEGYPLAKKRRTNSATYQLFINDSGFIRLGIHTSGYVGASGAIDLSDNIWHHTAGVWDGTNVRIYIDGVQSGTPQAQTGSMTATTDSVAIGYGVGLHVVNIPYKGLLDELRIYNRALTSNEIFAHYSNGRNTVNFA